MISALQARSGNSLLTEVQVTEKAENNDTQAYPMLLEAFSVFLLPFNSISFINQGGLLCQFPCLGHTACVSKVTDLQGGLNIPVLLLSLNAIQFLKSPAQAHGDQPRGSQVSSKGRPSLSYSSGSGTWETRAHPR